MLFNSLEFAVFFIVVTAIYLAIHHKYRWLLLLLSSCLFYMAFVPIYILILGFTIVIDYFAGIFIEKSSGRKRKMFLVVSLVTNIGILAIFKYYNFFGSSINNLLSCMGFHYFLPFLNILLPIGLSFHTFQAMSYTIEVYKGNQVAERHFGIYALYVMFFPQLVAGPIERPQQMIYQFYQEHKFDYIRITDGLKLMAWGLFKKIVIADRLAIVVDNVYDHPYQHRGLSFIIATIFFSFQIFCDFSGYSDMAIGMAKVMGFKLVKNFDKPYYSKNIKEFWARWHISLSTWFRDYLYIPLGGNRVGYLKWCLNILIVFLISGLWHGANWTFVVWGLLHAIFFIATAALIKVSKKINAIFAFYKPVKAYKLVNMIITFGLVTFAWIFFRAPSIKIAIYIVKKIFLDTRTDFSNLYHHIPTHIDLGLVGNELVIAVFSIVLLEIIHLLQAKTYLSKRIKEQSTILRWAIYFLFLFLLVTFGETHIRTFIYFQF